MDQTEFSVGSVCRNKIWIQKESSCFFIEEVTSGGGICTASAIAPDVLLTAAHCVMSWKDETVAVLRTSISCESGFNVQHHAIKVRESIRNENYESPAFTNKDSNNDVGLIFLDQPLPPDFPIYRIADPSQILNQADLLFYGYGAEGQHLGGSGMLHKAEISSSNYKIDLEKGKIVVDQTKGKGLCHGDSGGPGLISVNGELQILGVNSYVHPDYDNYEKENDSCRGKSFLEIANNYLGWIKHQMALRQRYFPEATSANREKAGSVPN